MTRHRGSHEGVARRHGWLLAALLAVAGCEREDDGPLAPDVDDSRATAERSAADARQEAAREDEPPTQLDQQIAQIPSSPETEALDPRAVGAIVSCVVCHGTDGEGNPKLDTPRIGGLPEWYIARQLDQFRMGVRGATDDDKHGSQMRAITLMLEGDEVVADLAAYISTLDPPAAPTTISGDVEHGEQLYAVCTACHGMDARGSVELSTPTLVGQHDWYLVRQLEHFRDGLRGAHPEDVYGMQMRPIVVGTLMSRQDMIDVVAYIQSIPQVSGRAAPGETPERRVAAAEAGRGEPRTRGDAQADRARGDDTGPAADQTGDPRAQDARAGDARADDAREREESETPNQ